MRSQDRIAIVLFHTNAEVSYNFTELTDDNRKMLLDFANQIHKKGSTNIFQALKKSIDLIINRKDDKLLANDAAILFFTDGQPNCGITNTNEIITMIN